MKRFLIFIFTVCLLFGCGGGGGGSSNQNDKTIDKTPDPIVFSTQSGVALNTLITSNTAIISGINTDIAASIVGGEYSINNGMFVSDESTVSVNDRIKVRHTSSSTYNTQTITRLMIGVQAFDFISKTINDGLNNAAPVADAGVDQSITTGDLVFLDGGDSSDDDGDVLSFSWALDSAPNGSTASLIYSTTQTPSITPEVDGTYTISLVVNDGTTNSATDTVNIVAATDSNTPPVADAGVDQSITTGDLVFLDGGDSSDDDGDVLSFSWALDSAPNGSTASLISSTTQTPSITPDVDGTYAISLVVNDGTTNSATDTVNIVAASDPNTPPVADAGQNVMVFVGTTVFLDGTDSYDDDGDALTYVWSGIGPTNSTATLFSINTENPYFMPDVVGSYTFNLTVNDGTINSAIDSVTVTAVSLPVSSNIVLYSGNTYLGCWSCNEFNSESIHNSFSQYGSEFGTYSIRNEFSSYGSPFSTTSACNQFASSPPVIVDDTHYYGTMSINTFNRDSICNQFSSFYSAGDCAILENYCSD